VNHVSAEKSYVFHPPPGRHSARSVNSDRSGLRGIAGPSQKESDNSRLLALPKNVGLEQSVADAIVSIAGGRARIGSLGKIAHHAVWRVEMMRPKQIF
jgi:hypothetical protein